MRKVLYVPLDDRDCNYQFPWLLSQMTEGLELLRPPYEWMGFLKKPADREKIWEWLFEQAGECDYAILSVDTLVYGNIIGSRIHTYSMEECRETMDRFRQLKKQNPQLHIHAFNLAARVAAYNDNHEDPEYWQEYGYEPGCGIRKSGRKFQKKKRKSWKACKRKFRKKSCRTFWNAGKRIGLLI